MDVRSAQDIVPVVEHNVVIDAVNPFRLVREAYFDLASKSRAGASVIVAVCSDAELHRDVSGPLCPP